MKKVILILFTILSICAYGQVGINTNTLNQNTLLHISETGVDGTVSSKGIMIPRLTTTQRNAISVTFADNNLTIFNTDENCLNYYQASSSSWLSLCGTLPKASYTFTACNGVKVHGNYTAGVSLNSSNYISVPVTVTVAGAYTIIAQTANGYYFEKSGVFPTTGNYTVNLTGSGVPSTGPQTDAVSFQLNGVSNTSCTAVSVSVKSSQVSYGINCGGSIVIGTYNIGTVLDYNNNTISIPLTNVDVAGAVSFITTSNNGVNFIANQNITTTSTTLTLHSSGTPALAGTYTYTFTTNGANPQTCTFSVVFTTTKGTFADPANRCLEIYNVGQRTDGEYWVKTSSSDATPVKTFCDMTNGGYTLVWSYSEKTAYNTSNNSLYGNANTMTITGASSLTNDSPQNVITVSSGSINYSNYRLALATRTNIRSANPGTYRVRITNVPTDMQDAWGLANYFVANPTKTADDYFSGTNDYENNELNLPTSGKLFGYVYKNGLTASTGTFAGRTTAGLVTIYVKAIGWGNFGPHWDVNNQFRGDIMAPDGTTIDSSIIDNLFGYFGGTSQVNHHFGKCTSSSGTGGTGDDYSFATYKSCDYSLLKPHSSINGGEGRYLQWFVK